MRAEPQSMTFIGKKKHEDTTGSNTPDAWNDWLMNESGDMKRINIVKSMIGEHTRLITCLARWNGKDATKVVPEALKAAVGLYGFTKPRTMSGLVPLDGILSRPVSELQGDDRNIAVLARAYHRVSIHAVRNEKGRFVEPMK